MLTGVSLLVVEPSPSWPRLLSPQPNSPPPPDVRARLVSSSALTAVALTPAGSATRTGTSLLAVLPSPSSPLSLSPQAST